MRLMSLALLLVAGMAGAEPVELHVPGEISPKIATIDAKAMRGYAHDKITHITFHHEGFAGTNADLFAKASAARRKQTIQQRLANINHYHATDAGLGMIAYHYLVGPSGDVAKARPVKYKPATMSTEWGSSKRADFAGHFAVMALGDFNHESLTPAARLSMVKVMSEAQRTYRVPTQNIQPHRHHANTSCPGETILAEADALAHMVTIYSLQTELAARGCGGAADGVDGPDSKAALARLAKAGTGRLAGTRMDDKLLFSILDAPDLRCR